MGMNSKKSHSMHSEINVTPLVDVMLVLLVIFMVSTPMMQQGIDVNMPETERVGLSSQGDPLVVKIKRNKSVYVGKRKVSVRKLRKKLKAIIKTRKNKQVYIKADRSVNYGFVAKVMAKVKAAGISNIGLVTIPIK